MRIHPAHCRPAQVHPVISFLHFPGGECHTDVGLSPFRVGICLVAFQKNPSAEFRRLPLNP
jgi:hypothetical protein